MKRDLFLIIFCLVVMVGTAEARQMGGHGGGKGQGGGKMGCAMMGGGKMGGQGGGMMGGHGGGMMGGRGGGGHGPMGAFHHWMHKVMRHRDALNLSDDQIGRMEQFSALHAQSAIRNQAERKVLKIDYRQALRKQKVDMKAVEKILKSKADLHFRTQKSGVVFYTQILDQLTPEQKKMLWDTIGSPFPHAWEKGRHGGRHHMGGGSDGRHHMDGGSSGRHHMQEGYKGSPSSPKGKSSSGKENPQNT